jgi:hypothetical protein
MSRGKVRKYEQGGEEEVQAVGQCGSLSSGAVRTYEQRVVARRYNLRGGEDE